MLKNYGIIFVFSVLIFSGKIYASFDGEPNVYREDANIFYEGMLSLDGLEQIKQKAKINRSEIRWLVINSGGGEVGVSMDIGLWVFDNGLNVRVSNGCMSSCANYVFPAGKKKIIDDNAIVAWHGSVLQDDFDLPPKENLKLIEQIDNHLKTVIKDTVEREKEKRRILENTKQYMVDMPSKQKSFFNRIGVDGNITIIGQDVKYGIEDFWFLSVEDMEKFGVKNVIAPVDYSKTDVSRFNAKGHSVVFLELSQ